MKPYLSTVYLLRTLPPVAVWCALMLLIHSALAGGRVAVMLGALELGISRLGVGALIACFALLPMFLAVSAGRRIDKRGSYNAMWLAAMASSIGALLPWVWMHWISLAIAAVGIGLGHMGFQIAVQGLLGDRDANQRLRNYSWLAMAMAISGFSGPLIAGLSIDYLGHRWAFFMLGLGPIVVFWAVYQLRSRLKLVHIEQKTVDTPSRMTDLFAVRPLRYALMANLLLSSAWDTHTFLVPLYGSQQGFSATAIGAILAAFAAATFTIRMILPWLQRWVKPWPMIHFAMVSGAVYFLLYPWVTSQWLLMGLSFLLGLSLGSTQPSILSLLQQHAPPGRKGEAFGMRTALINGSQVCLPLGFGAAGSLLGIMPLFAVSSLALAVGAWLTRRGGQNHTDADLTKTPIERNDQTN